MPLRASLLLNAVVLLPLHAWAQPHAGASLVIELHREALVDHARIVLSDVAVVHASQARAAELGAIALCPAPRIGYVERLSRMQIEHAIRRQLLDAGTLNWRGAASVAVRTKTQMVPAQALSDAAMVALKSQFTSADGTLTMTLAVPLTDIEVPVGPMEVRARAARAHVQGGRAPVWVDLFVGGEMVRSVAVQLAVSVRRQAYVALHAMAPGERVGAHDFALAETTMDAADVLATDPPLQPFRVARAIRAGQALTRAAMLASGNVMRGDRVRVTILAGQIGIETAAVAMADAAPGQTLSVRPSGGQHIITGRVSRSGSVVIE